MATLSVEVEKVATPEAFVVPVPSEVAPSLNVTVSPEGIVPAPGAATLTVAVNVIDCPKTDGFTEDVSAVEVGPLSTTCDRAFCVALALKLVSPGYEALIPFVPTGSPETLIVAEVTPPLVESTPVPSVVLPMVSVTVPVGAPAPGATGATVTVNSTA